MGNADQREDFHRFVESSAAQLQRIAYAACRDRARSEDLVQTTLEKMWVAWPRIEDRGESPMGYARTVLVRSLVDEERRGWFRRERTTDDVPDRALPDDRFAVAESRTVLVDALAGLTRRQRLAVVLRHAEGLSVPETARLLGTSESNVKSATREGVAALRSALDDQGVMTR